MSRNAEIQQAESLAAESEQTVELTKQFLDAVQRSRGGVSRIRLLSAAAPEVALRPAKVGT